jgi:hypothetical protein
MARRLFPYLSCFLLACGACAGVGAAELGEAKMGSHIGQQVVADLELTALEDPSNVVQARLASIDVYRGASLDMPPVLASLNMNVMRRDGRQFLHITSLKPVQADHLHLFLELNDGARTTVRLATLWFTPDPTPPAPAPASTEPEPPPLAWPVAKAPPAAPVRIARAPVAPACSRQQLPQPDPVCAALDGKNAGLRAQIVKLEEKVTRLQVVAQAQADTASKAAPVAAKPVAPQPVPAAPAKPRATAQKVDPVPVKTSAAPPALPWGWIVAGGAAVFALVGAFQVWRRQRERRAMYATLKKRATDMIPAEPRLG